MNRWHCGCAASLMFVVLAGAGSHAQEADETVLLRPDRVFDGEAMQPGWVVLVAGDRIRYAGPAGGAPRARGREVSLAGATILPGLIEGHSHLLLHPYDETAWTDQVLSESLGERTARAVVHAGATLRAGVTTVRDLGTEGAGYADVGIKAAVEKGVIPGPRMLIATRALVTTGSYNPRGAPEFQLPKGAEVADGFDALTRATRDQIGRGADLIKVYADYRWGPSGAARPTFTQAELDLVVEIASSSGRPVAAHASTADGMRRAALAGVSTIEHGDGGTAEVYALMVARGVALCPTLAAGDAILRYGGWNQATDPEPSRITAKRTSFRAALDAGVTICFGGDVGVFAHGENIRELLLMHEYGMSRNAVLHAATAGNARIFGIDAEVGSIAAGMTADLIAVAGDPLVDLQALREIVLVMKGGKQVAGESPWN